MGSGSGHRRGARAPQARAARQSAARRQQIRWGLPARREADHSLPRSPSRPRKEVTGALRTPARRLGRGGGWLRATSARGGCGSGPELPTMVWRRERRRVPRPSGATVGGCRARPRSRTQTLGSRPGSRCRLPPTRPTCCAGGRSELRGSGAPAAAAPPSLPAPEGALRAESHSWAKALGAPSLTGSRAPPLPPPPPSRLAPLER